MRLLFVLFLFFSFDTFGQVTLVDDGERTGSFVTIDFANGLPTGWENTTDTPPALWEYRGPNTSPSIAVGGRGSCETGTTSGQPIQSNTPENGFFIFDSNYWDNDSNPCGAAYFGTGQAPGPHYATLTTASFDFSDHPLPALRFYSALRDYQCTASVEMSVNQGEWNTIYTDPFPNTGQTTPVALVDIPLVSAGSQSDVRFRFVFEGLYYYWMIDDIELYDLTANDLTIVSSKITSYIDNDYTTYPSLPYKIYPDEMSPLLTPSAIIRNAGGLSQTEVRLNASLERSSDLIGVAGSTSFGALELSPGETIQLTLPEIQSPVEIGGYDLVMYTTQSASDEDLSNNRTSTHFEITESTWAIEDGPVTASYYPPDPFVQSAHLAGSVFVPTVPGVTLESISVAVGNGTSTPSTMFAAVYVFHPADGLTLTPIAQSNNLTVTQAMLNDFGEENLTTIPFSTPVALEQDETYLIAVGSQEDASSIQFGLSSEAPAGASWLVFDQVNFFTLNKAPIIRCNLGDLTFLPEKKEEQMIVYPNPCNGILHWRLTPFDENYSLCLWDLAGKKVVEKTVKSVDEIDFSFLPKGYYSMTIANAENHFHHKIILN